MPVRSKAKTSFVYKKKRYASLDAAENVMKDESPIHDRLSQVDSEDSDNSSVLTYRIPFEPYIFAGKDKTLICGQETILDSIISGVSHNFLNIEWEQISGVPAVLDSPNHEDTQVTKQDGDGTDKVFALKVTNTETGVVNYDKVTVYGTPTDKVRVDGTGFGVKYREEIHVGTMYFNGEPTSIPLNAEGFQTTSLDRVVQWTPVQDARGLIRVDLLENNSGQYEVVGSEHPSVGQILAPPGKSQRTAYKLRFIYNLNGVEVYVDSNVIYMDHPVRSALAHDKIASASGSMGSFVSQTSRTSSEDLIVTDPNQYIMNAPAPVMMLGNPDRRTGQTKSHIDLMRLAQHGAGLGFYSDLTRTDKSTVGGG